MTAVTQAPADWRTLRARAAELSQMLKGQTDDVQRALLVEAHASVQRELMLVPIADAATAVTRLEVAALGAELGEVSESSRTVADTIGEVVAWLKADRVKLEREEADFRHMAMELDRRYALENIDGSTDEEVSSAADHTQEIAKLIIDIAAHSLVGFAAKAKVVARMQSHEIIEFEGDTWDKIYAAKVLNELKEVAL